MITTSSPRRLSSATVKRHAAAAYAAINHLDDAVDRSELGQELVELVNLRCSQINGCAYCVQYHTDNLRELGVPAAKLALVVVWREAGIFTEREQAALAWAEAVTLVAGDHVPDGEYEAARAIFGEPELANLTIAIGTINLWNRISVAFRYPPQIAP